MAHQPNDADVDDLVQVGLVAYHGALQKNLRAERPYALARTVLQREMIRYIAVKSRHGYTGDSTLTPHIIAHWSDNNTDQADLFTMTEYFQFIERECGATARAVAEQLVSPSGRCAQHIVQMAQRKRLREKDSRGTVSTIRISQHVVRTGMQLDLTQWNIVLNHVRTATRQWLALQRA
jgi:hypothetical protein